MSMAGASSIEWTEATWNPVAGCLMVSPGCTNCYAMRMAGRLEAMGLPKYRGTTRRSGGRFVWRGRVVVDDEALSIPARWRKPRRIFVNSMSDLFQDAVPVAFIGKVWRAMEAANWHTYQILTKRPERMRAILSGGNFKVLPHVWLGTSVESGDYVDRIDLLQDTPAAVRFISFEPLVGRIGAVDLRNIDWAIVGGESGPRCRPMDPAWAREIRASCAEQGVAFFFKQWGGRNKRATGRRLDGRTWDAYPAVADCA
jgi:protein gp37